MAVLLAILNALRRAVQRDLGTFAPVRLNNFFIFILLMLYGAVNSGVPPRSAEPLLALLALLALFPLSSDPLARIPTERLRAWPLDRNQRWALRLASLALSPIFWIVLLMALLKAGLAAALSFLALAITVQVLVVAATRVTSVRPRWNLLRYIPQPPGQLGGLIRCHVRETLCLLDTAIAVSLSLGGCIYRWGGHADPFAFPVLAVLIALALSTYAQSLLGLNMQAGLTRSRLLPLRGWQILLAKDLAYLAVLMLLVLPLSPWCGLAAGVAVLAVSHHPAVFSHLPQQRWRFAGGRVLPAGILQMMACFAFGLGEERNGVVVLAVAAAGYGVSLWCYGLLWERRNLRETGR